MRLSWSVAGRGVFDGTDDTGRLRAGVADLTRHGGPVVWHGFTWEPDPRDTGHLDSYEATVAAVEALLDDPDIGRAAAPPPKPRVRPRRPEEWPGRPPHPGTLRKPPR